MQGLSRTMTAWLKSPTQPTHSHRLLDDRVVLQVIFRTDIPVYHFLQKKCMEQDEIGAVLVAAIRMNSPGLDHYISIV